MLPSLTNEGVHPAPKASFPHLLRNTSRTHSVDGSNTPTVQYFVTGPRSMECSSSCYCWIDRMSELVHLRASDDNCNVGQEGTTRWVCVYLDTPHFLNYAANISLYLQKASLPILTPVGQRCIGLTAISHEITQWPSI
jgi:hypothetical protein